MLALLAFTALNGCETDGFFDPSRTGYFETTPSAIPILTRLDVIEQAIDGPEYVNPSPDDLKPGDLSYKFSPGDVLKIQIPSLMQTGQTEIAERVVDQTGDIQLPVINKVQAAGLTTEDLQASIEKKLEGIIKNPKAFVSLQEGRAFQFRILGSVDQPGLYALNKPDLRLLDAVATARGASASTTRIFITREIISEENKVTYGKKAATPEAQSTSSTTLPQTVQPTTTPATPTQAIPSTIDIDQLINELPNSSATPATPAPTAEPTPVPAAAPTPEPTAAPTAEPTAAPTTEPTAAPTPEPTAAPTAEPTTAPTTEPAAAPTPEPAAEPTTEPAAAPTPEPTAAPTTEPAAEPTTEPSKSRTQLGLLQTETRPDPPVDIDQLAPATLDDRAGKNSDAAPVVNSSDANTGEKYVFDNASQSWVRTSSTTSTKANDSAAVGSVGSGETTTSDPAGAKLKSNEAAEVLSRKRESAKKEKYYVIDISYNDLVRGQPNLNIVIRPGDLIYCDSGQVGVVYIDGEISRPGVYNLPTSGRLTLSRLVAAAGGVSELAIPERCDLVRRLGSDKEACVRVSLAAIRNRAEPDIFLKPDDHVIVGTNFWALPLSRFRRDLSFPNSVGFQLDRNFGNDVFGAPPTGVNIN